MKRSLFMFLCWSFMGLMGCGAVGVIAGEQIALRRTHCVICPCCGAWIEYEPLQPYGGWRPTRKNSRKIPPQPKPEEVKPAPIETIETKSGRDSESPTQPLPGSVPTSLPADPAPDLVTQPEGPEPTFAVDDLEAVIDEPIEIPEAEDEPSNSSRNLLIAGVLATLAAAGLKYFGSQEDPEVAEGPAAVVPPVPVSTEGTDDSPNTGADSPEVPEAQDETGP